MLVVDAMVGLLEQELGRRSSEFIARLGDRAQGHSGRGRVLDVVVPDDGDVIGNASPACVRCWRRPSATRSLAQNAAVGRRFPGCPSSRSPASRPSLKPSPVVGNDVNASGASPVRATARAPACVPVRDLRDRVGPPDETDAPMAAVEQVLHCELATLDVVDADGAPLATVVVEHTIEQDDRDALAPELEQLRARRVGGSDEQPADAKLGEVSQILVLARRVLIGVAEKQRESFLADCMLDPAGDIGEERVARVEQNVGHDRTATSLQLTGGAVRDEPELVDRLLDPRPRGRPNDVWTIQDVRNGADRDTPPRRRRP